MKEWFEIFVLGWPAVEMIVFLVFIFLSVATMEKADAASNAVGTIFLLVSFFTLQGYIGKFVSLFRVGTPVMIGAWGHLGVLLFMAINLVGIFLLCLYLSERGRKIRWAVLYFVFCVVHMLLWLGHHFINILQWIARIIT